MAVVLRGAGIGRGRRRRVLTQLQQFAAQIRTVLCGKPVNEGLYIAVVGLLACAVLINICASEDYGFPYTAPLSPFRRRGMSDTVYRAGMKKMQRRGFTVEEYNE